MYRSRAGTGLVVDSIAIRPARHSDCSYRSGPDQVARATPRRVNSASSSGVVGVVVVEAPTAGLCAAASGVGTAHSGFTDGSLALASNSSMRRWHLGQRLGTIVCVQVRCGSRVYRNPHSAVAGVPWAGTACHALGSRQPRLSSVPWSFLDHRRGIWDTAKYSTVTHTAIDANVALGLLALESALRSRVTVCEDTPRSVDVPRVQWRDGRGTRERSQGCGLQSFDTAADTKGNVDGGFEADRLCS
jgi:hypothetical protein